MARTDDPIYKEYNSSKDDLYTKLHDQVRSHGQAKPLLDAIERFIDACITIKTGAC